MTEQPVPDQVDLIDVSAQSLDRLLRDRDPALTRQIDELLALLKGPRETTLAGWNNYLSPGEHFG